VPTFTLRHLSGGHKVHITIIVSGSLLLLWALLSPSFFNFIQHRVGIKLQDPVLQILPAANLSTYIFLLVYGFTLVGLICLIRNTYLFAVALQGYVILTAFRIVTILIFPLDDPDGLILLTDPVTDNFFYRQVITRDLFFSGHVSLIFMLGFAVTEKPVKGILFWGGCCLAIMLLVQHVHYVIDVIVAPLFAYAAILFSKTILKDDRTKASL
jgi:hypothetical protein